MFSFYRVSVFWWILFSQDSHPEKSGEKVADAFKSFKNDIEKFSQDFKKYIEKEGKGLSKEAEMLVADIKADQAEIDRYVLQRLLLCVALEFLNHFVAASTWKYIVTPASQISIDSKFFSSLDRL